MNAGGFVRLRHCMVSAYDETGEVGTVYGLYGFVNGVDGVIFAASCELFGLDGAFADAVSNAERGVHCWDGGINPIANF